MVAKDVPLKVTFEKLTRKRSRGRLSRSRVKLAKDAPAARASRKKSISKTNDPDSPLVPIVVEGDGAGAGRG